jgi:hypothetical protein
VRRIVNLNPRMWVFENLVEIGASLSIVKMIKLACVIVEKRKTLPGQSTSCAAAGQ